MNWGKGIAAALILFIGFIIFLAFSLINTKVDLESEDYYQREIAYEEEISFLNNANQLKEKVKISVTETHIVVKLPEGPDIQEVEVSLKRPNDDKEDKLYTVGNTKTFTIDKNELVDGVYNIELSYTADGVPCLQKEKIYI